MKLSALPVKSKNHSSFKAVFCSYLYLPLVGCKAFSNYSWLQSIFQLHLVAKHFLVIIGCKAFSSYNHGCKAISSYSWLRSIFQLQLVQSIFQLQLLQRTFWLHLVATHFLATLGCKAFSSYNWLQCIFQLHLVAMLLFLIFGDPLNFSKNLDFRKYSLNFINSPLIGIAAWLEDILVAVFDKDPCHQIFLFLPFYFFI